jgi:hypothetical protein
MRTVRTLALTGSLLVTAAAMSSAVTPKAKTKTMAKKTAAGTITCPIMKVKTPKSKAIKVTAANGKSTYVCCKGCVQDAKKLLMAKK